LTIGNGQLTVISLQVILMLYEIPANCLFLPI